MLNKKKLHAVAIILILMISNFVTFLLAGLGIINMPNRVTIPVRNSQVGNELRKLSFLEMEVNKLYYKDIEDETLINGAMKGLFMGTGDVYSEYYTQKEFNELMESSSGHYQGIGILVTQNEAGQTEVVTPIKGTPAAKAGIQSKDIIIKVDGEDVAGKGMQAAISMMRGEKNTDVKVTVVRGTDEIVFDLKRQEIAIESVASKMLGDIGYISISEFSQTTGSDFTKHLKELKKNNPKGLVIDLRNNGGGLIDTAVEVGSEIMDAPVLVYTQDKYGKREDYKATGKQVWDKPIVMLVNENSASASEILAGAFQDLKVGTLIGTKTFGKGIVQIVKPLDDGTGYKITTSEYFSPKGRNIHGEGLVPDVVIELPEDLRKVLEVPEAQDNQLQKALEILNQ